MAKLNTKSRSNLRTKEGGAAVPQSAEAELRRSVMTCLLWEDGYYESGHSIADRIKSLIPMVDAKVVADIAFSARDDMKLRHVPLYMIREMAKLPEHKKYVADLLFHTIQRADELSEFMAIYWKDGKQPISAQVKKGLARAFTKFTEYDLAKYNRDSSVKLKDVLFMVHAKPEDASQKTLFKKLVDGKLETPDTWEVSLSGGKDKKETFTRLIEEKKLGGLALLRNLRNMKEACVDSDLIREAIVGMKTDKILPFRFISAAKYAPEFEPELETAMFACLSGVEKLDGRTGLLVDVSGSMNSSVSSKSELTRMEAACALAILIREISNADIHCFSEQVKLVPARRGFALRDAIVNSMPHSSTYLGEALRKISESKKYDRLIVITDEQTADGVGSAPAKLSYMVNVASEKNAVGFGKWVRVTGWSEHIVKYIAELERA